MLQLLVVVVPCEMSGEMVTLHVPSELWSALLVRVKVRTDGVDPVLVPPLLAITAEITHGSSQRDTLMELTE